ncbi:MAG: hypothetical protein PHC34_10420 [Candidatus Gastranaerophilales bacterium]|nr:hypothetical protein [Candidatus Gastranaerophilales bacterium]
MIYQTQIYNNSYILKINNINRSENIQSVSFKGIKLNGLPEVEILTGITPEFINKVVEAMQQYPKPLMQKILDAKFKIILAEKTQEGLQHAGIPTELIRKSVEKNYGVDSSVLPGITCYNPFNENNIIVLADIPHSREIPQKAANHELSHGVVFQDKLFYDKNFTNAVFKDRESLSKKLQNGDQLLKLLFEKKFLKLTPEFFFDEMLADTIAWGCRGGGWYGSKFDLPELYKHHADDHFMKKLFPNVIRTISKRYRDAGLVYTIY